MKVLIAYFQSLPDNSAASNRVLCHLLGFKINGVDATAFSFRTKPPLHKGQDRANVYYTPRMIARSGKLAFWVNKYGGYLLGILYFIRLLKKQKCNSVLVYGNNTNLENCIVLVCKLRGVPIFKEESEHPSIYGQRIKSVKGWLHRVLFSQGQLYKYRMYDGLLVMTNCLKEFFLSKGFSSDRLVLIPQTVDFTRFSNLDSRQHKSSKHLTYIGSFDQGKDGVMSLIRAFKLVLEDNPDLLLNIAGSGSKEDFEKIKFEIYSLGLEGCVKLLGSVSADSIPELLSSSRLLLSCRPDSIQARYGFPTKIAEYLASGKPVVTTAYGDLKHVLTDGKNAFVATSSNISDFAAKIAQALEDETNAELVGERGQETAVALFDPAKQTKILIDFVRKLKQKRDTRK